MVPPFTHRLAAWTTRLRAGKQLNCWEPRPPASYNIVFFASGYPRPAPGIPRTRTVHGISFAVANMTAFLVRACELDGGERTASRQAMMREALLREGERKIRL
jgi:hypothetical protein